MISIFNCHGGRQVGFLFLKLQKAENTGAVCNCSPPGLLSLFKASHTGRAENEEEHRLFQKKKDVLENVNSNTTSLKWNMGNTV